jgi:chromate reductase, NAD(P)H dehydrogenase (quinone)
MRILAISGSLRAASHNTALLRVAAELAPDGVELELLDGLGALPHYNEDDDGAEPPLEVARLRASIGHADALLISTPEYNGTIPGVLKNAVDWASRPYGAGSSLWGKPVAVIGASVTDYGAVWAQDHLRKALGIAGARVLESELPLPRAGERFDASGRLLGAETRELLSEIVGELVQTHEPLAEAA